MTNTAVDTQLIDPGTYVTLAPEQVTMRATNIANTRWQTAVQQVELQALTHVLTGSLAAPINIQLVWDLVLHKHNHGPVAYDDLEQSGHAPYDGFRVEANSIFQHLQALSAGEEVVEDTFVYSPSEDGEAESSKRHLDAVLAWATEMVEQAYRQDYRPAGDLLDHIGYEAYHEVKQSFVWEWFSNPYALGYSIMEFPTLSSSPFGDLRGQLALLRSLSTCIRDAAENFLSDELPAERRAAYGHIVALLWPVLKGAACHAAKDTNSPLRAVPDGDDLGLIISYALTVGLEIAPEASRGLNGLGSTGSKVGFEVENTTTPNLVAAVNRRIANEQVRNRAPRL